jgi:hypothetical protein
MKGVTKHVTVRSRGFAQRVVGGLVSLVAGALACLGQPNVSMAQSFWSNPDGQLGSLAPENLNKKRAPAPTNFTGMWMIDGDFMFVPFPKFKPEAQRQFDLERKAMAEGKAANQTIGNCWPPGMPTMMTRVWPINVIQTPTALVMIANFENQVRWIYTDGRKHTDPDIYAPTYNGESIGHWEGKELVVDTQGFESTAHNIDGVPVSDGFHIIERMRLKENGEILEVDFTMTDPQNWEGEWKSVKHWRRQHVVDFLEVHCLPNTNDGIPGLNPAYQIDTTK